MKKIKVMILIPSLGMGGAENIVINIAKYINKKKFDLKIVSLYSMDKCVDKYRKIIEEYKIPVLFLSKKEGLDINTLFKLLLIIKKEKPDVVHSHLYACIYALVPEFICRVPGRFHTVHNMALKELPTMYIKIMKFAYHFMHIIPIAINGEVKKSIKQCYGLHNDQIPIVYNGVDIKNFYKKEKEIEGITLINVGRFSPQKNHILLIKCFYEVIKSNQDVKLVLVGDGECKDIIQKEVSRYRIADKIYFAGNVSNVEDYLAIADIFVMTSDYEGLPLSVIEAMAAGVPVISTKAGGVVELIQNQENGILVDVGDDKGIVEAIKELCNDSQKRKKMGKQARNSVAKYSVENMIRQYEDLYEK